jgi:hypothetical protein
MLSRSSKNSDNTISEVKGDVHIGDKYYHLSDSSLSDKYDKAIKKAGELPPPKNLVYLINRSEPIERIRNKLLFENKIEFKPFVIFINLCESESETAIRKRLINSALPAYLKFDSYEITPKPIPSGAWNSVASLQYQLARELDTVNDPRLKKWKMELSPLKLRNSYEFAKEFSDIIVNVCVNKNRSPLILFSSFEGNKHPDKKVIQKWLTLLDQMEGFSRLNCSHNIDHLNGLGDLSRPQQSFHVPLIFIAFIRFMSPCSSDEECDQCFYQNVPKQYIMDNENFKYPLNNIISINQLKPIAKIETDEWLKRIESKLFRYNDDETDEFNHKLSVVIDDVFKKYKKHIPMEILIKILREAIKTCPGALSNDYFKKWELESNPE